jgi:hypothetical protein
MLADKIKQDTGLGIGMEVFHRATGELGIIVGFVVFVDEDGDSCKVTISWNGAMVRECSFQELSKTKIIQ